MLVDTDVIIWHLRGSHHASNVLEHNTPFSISAVTVMEVLTGIRNREEMRAWKSFLKLKVSQTIPVDEQISSKATFWMEEFVLTHRLRMGDALIAATADTYGLELLTGNVSDYRYLPNLKIKAFKHD